MYDEHLIGKAGYKAIQHVRSKIKWDDVASAFKVKDSFDKVARKLVKRMLLSDDGKSMQVLYLDKLGVDFVVAYIGQNPNVFKDLEEKLNR
ncbi:MAG: hypothetical protein HMLIMOIP_000896 [Candidatus Nitrosomirales archaeon]|jgi:hypothetical protein